MRKLLPLLIALAALMSHAAAAAQTPPRAGTWANLGLGWGSMNCEDCHGRHGGLSGAFAFGLTLNPRAQLGVATHAWMRDVEFENVVVPPDTSAGTATGSEIIYLGTELVSVFGAMGRFYLSDAGRLFLLGGLGLGLKVSTSGRGETGAAGMIGLGYDIPLSQTVSLTPFFNGVAIRIADLNPGFLQVGLGLTIH